MQSDNRAIEITTNFRRGFTVLELLVASLLLGMLMTILTMIFNQSSIAWRTGVAGVADMDDVREAISDTRYRADNAYIWQGAKNIHSVFNDSGNIVGSRQEYINNDFNGAGNSFQISDSASVEDSYKVGVSCGSGKVTDSKNYVVNVRSAGPDRSFDDKYDNIYSVPDDPKEW